MNPLLSIRELASDVLVERLGWVLVHTLWQFTLIAFVAALVVRLLGRSRAAARYTVLVGAMAAIVVSPMATWFLQPEGAAIAEVVPDVAEAPIATGAAPAEARMNALHDEPADSALAVNLPAEELPSKPAPLAIPEVPVAAPTSLTWAESVERTLRPWLAWIVVGWSLGVLLCSFRPLLGWHALWRLRRVGVSPVGEEISAALRRVAGQLGLRRVVQVLQSTLVQTPVLVGYFRPAILLPVGLATGLPIAQLEAILAHELAHVRRHDFVVNLLQTLVETLCFYHPAVWWLSRQIRVEREHCCDDLVVGLLGNRIEYGRALLAVEEVRGTSPVLALGMADGVLLSRVRRLFGGGSERVVDRWPAALLSLAGVGFALVLALVWHQAARDEGKQPAAAAIAKLPGDITVEFVGVSYHPSKDKAWWKPNGSPLEPRPTLEGGFSVMSGSPEQARCREFLIHIRGLPREHAVTTEYGSVAAATGSSYSNGLWVGEHGAGPFKSDTTSVRVGLTTEAYGPTVEIDITGTRQPAELSADLRPFYDRIVPLRVEGVDGQTVLILDGTASNNLFEEAEWELHAVDVDGEKHRRSSESDTRSRERHFTFKLPRNRIARFEFRVRPYRHWATFEEVSLEPGKESDVKVSVETVPATADFPCPRPEDVGGLDLSRAAVRHYSEATRLSPEQQTPELLVPGSDPAEPWRRPKNVFLMPLAENIWLKYPAGSGHFFINHRPDGTWQHERMYGPIEGDPFEVLKLEEYFREQLKPGATGGDARYRLTLMLRTGEPELIRRAWRLIEPELAVAATGPDAGDPVAGSAVRYTEQDAWRFERIESLGRVREAMRDETEAFRRPELTDVAARMREIVAAVEAAIDATNDAVADSAYESVTHLQPGLKAKIPAALWGPPLDGLRLGLVPSDGIDWSKWQQLPTDKPLPTHITALSGDELQYLVVVENVSDREIKLSGYVVGQEMARGLEMLDQHGRPVDIENLHASTLHIRSYWRLKPGERQLLTMPAVNLTSDPVDPAERRLGYSVKAVPGHHTLRCTIRFGNLDNERHRYVPGKSEWIGELSTGTQRVVVADSGAGNESGAERIQPENADQAHAVATNGEIRGRLTDLATGQPVAGATVACGAIINDSGNGGGSSVVTDAEGRYRLPVPSPGIYNVWLKNYPPDVTKTAAADDGILVEAGKAAMSQMWLATGRKVAGKVVDSAGNIGANLTVYCYSAALPQSGGVQSTNTNLKGDFELILPPGRAYVYALEPGEKTADNPLGTGRTASAHVMVSTRTDPAPLTLTLQRPDPKFGDPEWLRRPTPWTQIVRREGNQDVTGTVVDETGMPVPDAKVFSTDGPIVATGATGEFRVKTQKATQLVMFAFLPGYHVWFGTPTSGDVLKVVLEKKGKPWAAVAAELPQDPLQRKVALSVNQTPLREAIETVAAQAGLKVEFDVPVTEFNWNQKVTEEFEEIPLFAALNLLYGLPIDNGIIRRISRDKLVLTAFRGDQVASLNETERALQTLAKLIDEFSAAPNDWQQLEAARRIIDLGGKWAIPRLLPFLTSANRRARCNASFVLACLEDERGLATLIRELQDTAPRPTELKRSDGTEDAARQITSDRYYAAHLLGQLGDKAAVPALIDATRDRTIDYAAAIALGEISDRQAIPALRQMLKESPRQRLWAAYGLAAVGEVEGFEILSVFLADPVWEQRRHAVEALGKIGDRRSVPVVVKVLKDEHANVRVSAARALGQIGDPAAISALIDALGDTETTKVNGPTTVASEVTKAIATIREKQNGGQGDKFQEEQKQVPDGNQLIRATLTGRFVYDGEAPPRKDLWPQFAEIDATQRQPAGPDGRFSGVEATYREFLKQNIQPSTLDPSLLVDETGGIANVVIWVTSKEIPWTPPADLAQRAVTIRLKDGHFSPRMTVAMVGQPVVVENLDPVPFNFHAEFSRALNSPVNMLMPARSDEQPPLISFRAAEPYPSRFRSDLGPWANGLLMIHGNPYVAVSQADGSFTLPELPPGEWEFRVWHERAGYVRHWPQGLFKRVISPGRNDLGTIVLKPEVFGVKAAVTGSPPSNREQIGEVGGKPVFRDEVTAETLHSIFLTPVLERYREKHRAEIAPTDAELRSAGEYFDRKHRERLEAAGGEAKLREQMRTIETQLATPGQNAEEEQRLELEHLRLRSQLRPPSDDGFARFALNNWKLQRHLYDNYGGGRILWQQAGLEAFDAMRRWMEEQEKAGVFEITDAVLRAKLYEYWTRDHGPFLTADKERIRKEFLEPEWLAPAPAKDTPSAD